MLNSEHVFFNFSRFFDEDISSVIYTVLKFGVYRSISQVSKYSLRTVFVM
jgi:hypothetical protein